MADTSSDEYCTPVVSLTRKLIREVKKRPVLWDRKHDYYNSRIATDREWVSIAGVMEQHKEFLKLKWKNLRDQFHKESKKVTYPLEDNTDKSYVANYAGKWIHFEALLYLKDSIKVRRDFYSMHDETEVSHRSPSQEKASENDDEDEEEEPEHKIKEELIVFEESILGYDTEAPTFLPPQAYEAVPSTATEAINETKNDLCLKKKASNLNLKEDHDRIKRRKLPPAEDTDEADSDLHFFKSLLPYMRSLNPVRKLIVRNEIQTLLFKEHLCEKCNRHSCDY